MPSWRYNDLSPPTLFRWSQKSQYANLTGAFMLPVRRAPSEFRMALHAIDKRQ